MLSEPRPEYSGIVLGETFGNFAFAIACRVLGLRDLGPALSPFNAFLILTGVETLPLRMQCHSDNGPLRGCRMAVEAAEVAWVSYPGLKGDKYNAVAKKYVPKGCGAVLTVGLKGGYDAGVELVSNVKLFSHLARSATLARDHSPRVHHTQAIVRRDRPAPDPTWCGCRSELKTRPTARLPILSRA